MNIAFFYKAIIIREKEDFNWIILTFILKSYSILFFKETKKMNEE